MPNTTPHTHPFRRLGLRLSGVALAAILTLGTAACTDTSGSETASTVVGSTSTATNAVTAGSLFDSSTVHDIEIVADPADVEAAISTYLNDDDKTWITATVTIDGEVFDEVGLRLKGNSSLRAVSTDDAETPEELPWLVKLDKYVDEQSLDGVTSFVIRSNTTETALNEAVALELLGMAGLATEEATATRVSFNDGEQSLRLVIENPDDAWAESEFATVGTLYKAESTGDYTYRGDDPDSYDEVFDLEAGEEDYAPLTSFLQFINESDDATFTAELGTNLDVDAFASYLAVQELVANNDDIDGAGNNSYLHYDTDTGLMTVVAWDQNLSFGVQNVGGGGGQGNTRPNALDGDAAGTGEQVRPQPQAGVEDAPVGEPQAGVENGAPVGGPPAGVDGAERPVQGEGAAADQGGAAGPRGSNILAERFLADETFNALYTQRLTELTGLLYTDGAADDVLTTWTSVLTDQAADLIAPETIQSEAASIAAYFD